jgi:hypothetical protein
VVRRRRTPRHPDRLGQRRAPTATTSPCSSPPSMLSTKPACSPRPVSCTSTAATTPVPCGTGCMPWASISSRSNAAASRSGASNVSRCGSGGAGRPGHQRGQWGAGAGHRGRDPDRPVERLQRHEGPDHRGQPGL